MDYISAFQSLKTNNKYARKSPHKAVLLLTVIDMYENKLLSANEIKYDECLLKTFQKVWNKVLPNETTFFTNVYFPFWYMQSDGFWFNVPVRGKEDAFRELWESRTKPTESRIKELIQYAILDEGLYFMMTMPSGRSSLKRALLEEYTELSEREIDRMCVVKEVELEDKSAKAMDEYQAILDSKSTKPQNIVSSNCAGDSCFQSLSDNLQIALNFEYYSFLKSHRVERDLFREIFPSVEELVYRIMSEPYKQGDLNYSFATIYENFLGDLRVALMSEDDSLSFIDNISSALSLLQGGTFQEEKTDALPISAEETIGESVQVQPANEAGELRDRFAQLYHLFASEENRKGKSWSKEEEEFISICYEKGWDCARIGGIVGRTPLAIYVRLTNNLGYIIDNVPEGTKVIASVKDDTTSSPKSGDFRIENKNERCFIYNARNESVFSTSGSLKLIRGKVYRFNYKPGFFTVKAIERNGDKWYKGTKLLVARSTSDLYRYMERHDCSLDDIQDFIELSDMHLNQLKFIDHWYDFDGNRIIE